MSKKYNITLIPGDGIGPELCEAVKIIVKATKVDIEWEQIEAGADVIDKYGTPLPEKVISSIKKNKVALKGPITTPIGTGFRSVNVALRKKLDLYACLRPAKSLKGVVSRYKDLDLIVVRENTEDLYAGVEFAPDSDESKQIIELSNNKITKGSAISIKPISREATHRVVKFAFDYADKHNRKKVTAVTKANIMKFTDGLFFEAAQEIAKEYKHIEYEEKLIDNMCMQLVQRPENYDVLVLPNLYGDIVSDLCAGLVGGLGVAPGANIGKDCALFEPVHGSAPKYKGQNRVNPTALALSAGMMLDYIGENQKAEILNKAIAKIIEQGKYVTIDLGGNAGTKEMAQAIAEEIACQV